MTRLRFALSGMALWLADKLAPASEAREELIWFRKQWLRSKAEREADYLYTADEAGDA